MALTDGFLTIGDGLNVMHGLAEDFRYTVSRHVLEEGSTPPSTHLLVSIVRSWDPDCIFCWQ